MRIMRLLCLPFAFLFLGGWLAAEEGTGLVIRKELEKQGRGGTLPVPSGVYDLVVVQDDLKTPKSISLQLFERLSAEQRYRILNGYTRFYPTSSRRDAFIMETTIDADFVGEGTRKLIYEIGIVNPETLGDGYVITYFIPCDRLSPATSKQVELPKGAAASQPETHCLVKDLQTLDAAVNDILSLKKPNAALKLRFRLKDM